MKFGYVKRNYGFSLFMKNTGKDIKIFYQKRFKRYGVDPKSLSWHERGAAHQRFRQFWAEIDFNNKSVLDVGCGFGEMAKFLKKRYEGVNYTGVDIVPEFVSEASLQYPYYRFLEMDYFSSPLKEKFDIILASGVLNSNVDDNMGYRKKAIKVMFEHTKKVLAFNMLGAHPQPKNNSESNVWYTDSLQVLDYSMSLSRRVILRANYHPTDFTILMYTTKKKKKR